MTFCSYNERNTLFTLEPKTCQIMVGNVNTGYVVLLGRGLIVEYFFELLINIEFPLTNNICSVPSLVVYFQFLKRTG